MPELAVTRDEKETLRRSTRQAGPEGASPAPEGALSRPIQAAIGHAANGRTSFPAAMGPAGLLALQRLAGNRAVTQALARQTTAVQRIAILDDPGVQVPGEEEAPGSTKPMAPGIEAGAAGGAEGEAGAGAGEAGGGAGAAGAGAGAAGAGAGAAGAGAGAGTGSGSSGAAGGAAGPASEAGHEIAGGAGAGHVAMAGEGMSAPGGHTAGEATAGDTGHEIAEAAGEAAGGLQGAAAGASAGAGHEIGEAAGGLPAAASAGAVADHAISETAGTAGVGHAAGATAGATEHAAGGTAAAGHAAGAAGADHAAGGGGLGGGGGPGETEQVPEVAEPGDVAVHEIGDLGKPAPEVKPETVDEPSAPEHEQPENLEGEAGGIEGQVSGGGGGIVDALLNRAISTFRGIAGRIGSGVRSAASSIASRVSGFFGQAFSFASNLVTTVVRGVRTLASGIASEIRGHLSSLKAGVSGIVSRVFGAVRGAMSRVAGAIRNAVTAILSGQPVLPTIMAPIKALFGTLFGGIGGQITAIIERIRGLVNGLIDRVLQAVTSFTQAIVNGLTFLANLLTTAVTFLQQELTRLVQWVTQQVSGLPDLLRRLITAIVNAVVAMARRILNNIVTRARAWIARTIQRVVTFVQNVVSIVTRVATAIRNAVRTVFDTVAAGVRTVTNAVNRVKTWLIGKATAFASRALRTVLMPIAERLKQRVLALIGPAAGDAIRRAELAFPNGMPTPPEVTAAALKGAQQVGSTDGAAILRGLTNPEGDHIAYGVTYGGSVGGGVGASASLGATFEIVLDYRRNDIGFFFAPQAGAQANIGDLSAVENVTGVGAWGTVASFGDPSQDVLGAYSGWFANASYGGTAGLAVEGGLGVSSGGAFYRGLQAGRPLFSYTPLGADSHPVPGTGTPATVTPGTPDVSGTLTLGEVRFPRQSSDPGSAPGGAAAIDHAVEVARDYPTGHPRGQLTSIDVLGEASRVWQRPAAGRTRAEENAALADRRAQNVAAELRPRVAGLPVTAHGNGDLRAAAAGKPETDASAQDQRASMVASTHEAGTPGTTTPGTPPREEQDRHTVSLPALANPFGQRAAWGWDTTLGVAGYGGAKVQAGVYAGAGVSYSFPIGKVHMDPQTMAAIRATVGFLKLTMDVVSISPLGFIRDVLGLVALVSEHASVVNEMTSAVTDWAIPLPPGAVVA